MSPRVDSLESAFFGAPARERMRYPVWDSVPEIGSITSPPSDDGRNGDRLIQFLDDLAACDWQFQHPVFDYIERIANRQEVVFFIFADRHWHAVADTGGAAPSGVPDALRFQDLLGRMSDIPPAPDAALAMPRPRDDRRQPGSSAGAGMRAEVTRRAWTIVDTLADDYQHGKLLAAGERLRLRAPAMPCAPAQAGLRSRVERIARSPEVRAHEFVDCIEACLALRTDHYDGVLDELMSLVSAR